MLNSRRSDLAPLTICLFGPPEIRIGGVPISRLHSRRGLWILAILALRDGREVERPWLAGTLWPESDEGQAYHNLRMTLTDLRHALGTEARRITAPSRKTLGLDLDGADVDAVAFDRLMARGMPPPSNGRSRCTGARYWRVAPRNGSCRSAIPASRCISTPWSGWRRRRGRRAISRRRSAA